MHSVLRIDANPRWPRGDRFSSADHAYGLELEGVHRRSYDQQFSVDAESWNDGLDRLGIRDRREDESRVADVT